MRELRTRLLNEIRKVVVGQDETADFVLAAISVQGHVLVEGVPGVAKSLLASTVARALGVSYRRVQFTPDMLPSDITGTMTLRNQELAFRPGPVFTNVMLADEINRTPPKAQAALLEAMQERHVSVDGVSHPLPDPFLVIATQNPIEYEGTYPLPEAQLDRFLLKIDVGYPNPAEEIAMLKIAHHGVTNATLDDVEVVTSLDELRELRARRRHSRHRRCPRLHRRARSGHPDTAERGAGCEPAVQRAPPRGEQGIGAPVGTRFRHPRRRRVDGHAGLAPPDTTPARSRARTWDER